MQSLAALWLVIPLLGRLTDAIPQSEPFYPSPWMDPEAQGWQDAYAKAKEFVSGLTLLEKVNLTTGVGWEAEQCVGQTGSIPRLGLAEFCLHDSPLGVRGTDYNSAFPSGQTAAATFDKELIFKRGLAMGREARAKGVTVLLGPVAGPLGRMPEGGRNWEGFSPDPVLTGVAMAASIQGIQEAGVVACAKHFIGNEQENFRQAGEAQGYGFDIDESLSSNIGDKALHELYLWPFADSVRAGVGSVMCAYQQVNNSYACQNSKLLNDILKDELGFQGFVMSDWQAQHTGAASAVAGLDMSMPGDTVFNSGRSYWGTNLTLAVLNGTVPEWRIDDMAMRIMAAFFKVNGTVGKQEPINFSFWTQETYGPIHWAAKKGYQQINYHVNVQTSPEGRHGDIIREIAAKGTVLLKNNGVLPLKSPKFIAVIGSDAGPNFLGPNACDNRGCDNGTLAMGWGSGTSNFPYLVTPDAALQARAIMDGTRYESVLSNYATTQIKNLVSLDNVTAIVFVNADSGEGFIELDGNFGDRKNLTLWDSGDTLIAAVASVNPNTIVVIHSPGPVLLPWHDHPNITAILWGGFPGEQSGNSITDVLYGLASPGRSPFTWGATRESYGTDVLYTPNNGKSAPQQDFTEGVFIDYRHFDKYNTSLIYPFGHGLTYSTFTYSNLRIEALPAPPYLPTTGTTAPAPTFGPPPSSNLSDYLFPSSSFPPIYQYIYPYLNTTSPRTASADAHHGQNASAFLPPGALDGSPRPRRRASGAPGGNPGLWDVLYEVAVDIANTGAVQADEVPQLYVALVGEADQPKVMLRGFRRVSVRPGETVEVLFKVTRRDVSVWDVGVQDWVVGKGEKRVFVGRSSRDLELRGVLG
ncbi:glycosyl hydrolase family 3 N terminal domain-containing protein [Podospora conica]|nr:glycosyl hydrolase family 3 N terminal domain-containing protein [Schizothecium conicum]